MTEYSVYFKNNSDILGDACVYQTDPNINDPNVMSLAWFSKTAHPTTNIQFSWTIDYSFVWSVTGKLKAGIIFAASQNWPADLTKKNQVSFTYNNQAHTFSDQSQNPVAGSLHIDQDSSIPKEIASVGIGMSGSGTFVEQAQPNIKLTFTPHPLYWITFGSFKQGQVLDTTLITDPAQLLFPPNIYNATALLTENNTWDVSYF